MHLKSICVFYYYTSLTFMLHRVKFLITKPTRCTNFSNLFLKWSSTCFGQFLCPSPGVFHCTHSNDICHTGLLAACEQDQDGTAVPSLSWCIYSGKTPDDGQRNCPKHVELHSKNKFEKLVHLVGFIIRNGFQSFLRNVFLHFLGVSIISFSLLS